MLQLRCECLNKRVSGPVTPNEHREGNQTSDRSNICSKHCMNCCIHFQAGYLTHTVLYTLIVHHSGLALQHSLTDIVDTGPGPFEPYSWQQSSHFVHSGSDRFGSGAHMSTKGRCLMQRSSGYEASVQSLDLGHVVNEVNHALAVSPLIVIP